MEVTTADQYQTRKRVFFVRSGKKPPSNVSHRRPLSVRSRVVTVQEVDSGLNGPQLIVSVVVGVSSNICVHAVMSTVSLTDNPM